LFRLSVPLLLVYRGARPDVPWLFVIVSATVLGWILSNASVFFQHAAIDEERMEELACFAAPYDENKSVTVVNENGMTETVVEIRAELANGFGKNTSLGRASFTVFSPKPVGKIGGATNGVTVFLELEKRL
jgi:hypothetical protein